MSERMARAAGLRVCTEAELRAAEMVSTSRQHIGTGDVFEVVDAEGERVGSST
jgi:hypothetical protein